MPIFTTADTAGYDLLRLIRATEHALPFELQWQNGPTIPRPFVRAETIAAKLAEYLETGCLYDVAQTKALAENLFNVTTVCDKWLEIFTHAAQFRKQACGDFSEGLLEWGVMS